MPYCMKCGEKVDLMMEKCPNCGINLAGLTPREIQEEILSEIKKTSEISEIPLVSPDKRLFSALIDLIIATGLTLLIWTYVGRKIVLTKSTIRLNLIILILPFLPAFYLVLKDSLGGKSFGKMIVGLTTVNLDKLRPTNLADSLLRNAIFAIIAVPILGWLAFSIFVILIGIQIMMKKSQRLGDGFAHTIVIEDKNLELFEKRNQN